MSNADPADPVGLLAEEFVERYRRGERPALQEYIDRFPEHAERIQQLFPMLVAMEKAGSGTSAGATGAYASDDTKPAPLPERLGDYTFAEEEPT